MEQDPLIIVDNNGDEHEFPAGMDPKRAGAIVQNKVYATEHPAPVGSQPHSLTQDLGGGPVSDEPGYNGPDTFWGGVGQSLKDQGRQLLNHLNPMLDTAAEPQDIGDMLNLVVPEMGGAIGATAHTAAGPVTSIGRGVEAVGASRPARMMERWAPVSILSGNPSTMAKGLAASATPSIVRATGRGIQKVGGALRKAEPVAAEAEEAITNPLWRDRQAVTEVHEPLTGEVPEMGGPRHGAAEGEFTEVPPTSAKELPPSETDHYLGQGDLESTLMQMSEEPESVVNYTSEPPVERPAPEGADMEATEMRGESKPLGTPRIKEWKPNHGPSDELIGQRRDAEGTRDAAKRLKISPKEVQDRAPRTNPRSLPTETRDRISAELVGMTPEERLTYLESAGSGLTRNFIETEISKLR